MIGSAGDQEQDRKGTQMVRTLPVLPWWGAAVDTMKRYRVRWVEAIWQG